MDFAIKRYGKYSVVNINDRVLSKAVIDKITQKVTSKCFVIDCKGVEFLENYETLELLCTSDIPLFNCAPIFTMQASILGQKCFPKIYMDLQDCINKKRALTKRRFKLVECRK